MTIQEIFILYRNKIDLFDLELLLANSLAKTREFVLSHPEYKLSDLEYKNLQKQLKRRVSKEPIAHILGHKEFYGLDFEVNKHTLVPRPETEMMVESVLNLIQDTKYKIQNTSIIDVGTGSGCIITSIADVLEKNVISSLSRDLSSDSSTSLRFARNDIKYLATDISAEALKVAKKNAKKHNLEKKIKFLHGNLLTPLIQNTRYKIQDTNLIITANLPYLSKEIYNSAPIDVKNFEPKSALYSPEAGLQHYRKLLEQLRGISSSCSMFHVSCFMEISPEQKLPLAKLIKSIFPKAKIEFSKDLAGKWRICKIIIQ